MSDIAFNRFDLKSLPFTVCIIAPSLIFYFSRLPFLLFHAKNAINMSTAGAKSMREG